MLREQLTDILPQFSGTNKTKNHTVKFLIKKNENNEKK